MIPAHIAALTTRVNPYLSPLYAEVRRFAGGGEVSSGPSIAGLRAAFDAALARHLSLPMDGGRKSPRAQNGMDAKRRVTQHNGNGQLLAQNMKLMKADQGYNLDGQDTLKLPDGRGVETTGLSLAPAYQEGKFNTCPNSLSCREECLGKTSGGNFLFGGGADLNAMKGPRLKHFQNTQAMLRDPEAFAVRLHDEIQAAKMKAQANGNMLGVRLNVLSDIHPKVYESLIRAHPDVMFYDYTKNGSSPVAPNHHLTYSSTGLSQPASVTGLSHDVENPHSNWKMVRSKIDQGHNVAMAFSSKSAIPSMLHDAETGKQYRVIDGDTHDFRPLDKQPAGSLGVIVGLRKKSSTKTEANAAQKSNGFFVHFDPKYVGKGTQRTQTNHVVVVAPQKSRVIQLTNDGEKE